METERLTVPLGGVVKLIGAGRSTVLRCIEADPDFPRPFKLTPNGVNRWLTADIRAYLATRAAQARQEAA